MGHQPTGDHLPVLPTSGSSRRRHAGGSPPTGEKPGQNDQPHAHKAGTHTHTTCARLNEDRRHLLKVTCIIPHQSRRRPRSVVTEEATGELRTPPPLSKGWPEWAGKPWQRQGDACRTHKSCRKQVPLLTRPLNQICSVAVKSHSVCMLWASMHSRERGGSCRDDSHRCASQCRHQMCATLSKRAYMCVKTNTKDTPKDQNTHLLPMPKRMLSHTACMLTHTNAPRVTWCDPVWDQALQASTSAALQRWEEACCHKELKPPTPRVLMVGTRDDGKNHSI